MTEMNLEDVAELEELAEEDLDAVSGGCWKGCSPRGCGTSVHSTTVITGAPSGYELSTIPGAPGYYGAQVPPAGFAGAGGFRVVSRTQSFYRFHR